METTLPADATPSAGHAMTAARPRRFVDLAMVLPYVVTVVLGLWLGGLVTLILFVSTMFTKARGLATDAAPILFDAFEKYQLVLAAVALLTLVLWRLSSCSRLKTAALAATLLATALAAVQIGIITPRIERYRFADRPLFDRYHHLASANYTTISVVVLIALILAVTAIRQGSRESPQDVR